MLRLEPDLGRTLGTGDAPQGCQEGVPELAEVSWVASFGISRA